MPLFEVAILETPKKGARKDDEEHTGLEKLVFGPVWTVAKDPQSAAISAILDNTDKVGSIDRTRMQVLVRPF